MYDDIKYLKISTWHTCVSIIDQTSCHDHFVAEGEGEVGVVGRCGGVRIYVDWRLSGAPALGIR